MFLHISEGGRFTQVLEFQQCLSRSNYGLTFKSNSLNWSTVLKSSISPHFFWKDFRENLFPMLNGKFSDCFTGNIFFSLFPSKMEYDFWIPISERFPKFKKVYTRYPKQWPAEHAHYIANILPWLWTKSWRLFEQILTFFILSLLQ